MIINKIAFGSKEEAFIEDRLKPGFNIIFSLDNNKGKTIVMQSCMYALGNEPIFPASFPYKDYYHYVDLTLNDGGKLLCCRYKDDFYLKKDESIYLLNGVFELKRSLNKIGFSFPIILKDGKEKMVDPVLFYQLFFIGQDENKTSNIVKSGYYNKNDFLEMIYSCKGIIPSQFDETNADDIKKTIANLQSREKAILKERDIFNHKNKLAAISSLSIDKEMINDVKKRTEEIINEIVSLSKERNRFITKYNNSKAVLDQLNSLKIRVNGAKLKCADCGSYNIEYESETEGFSFDVSDEITRNDIEMTLKDKMSAYNEEIEKRTNIINELQASMHKVIDDSKNINYEDVLYYAFLINNQKDYDKELLDIKNKIDSLQSRLNENKHITDDSRAQKEIIKNSIVAEMNTINKTIDPSSNNTLDIFTKQDVTYSGCEEAIYYLSRLYAIRNCLDHSYPLIMDHFRAGELSSSKEKVVIELFSNLSNQIIFTVTLKNEEADKYKNISNINGIDYNTNESNHILSTIYSTSFNDLLSKLKIKL